MRSGWPSAPSIEAFRGDKQHERGGEEPSVGGEGDVRRLGAPPREMLPAGRAAVRACDRRAAPGGSTRRSAPPTASVRPSGLNASGLVCDELLVAGTRSVGVVPRAYAAGGDVDERDDVVARRTSARRVPSGLRTRRATPSPTGALVATSDGVPSQHPGEGGPGLRRVVELDRRHREQGAERGVGVPQRLRTELSRAGGVRLVAGAPGLADRHEAGDQRQDEEHGGAGEGEPQPSDHPSTGARELDRRRLLGRGLLLARGQEPVLEVGEARLRTRRPTRASRRGGCRGRGRSPGAPSRPSPRRPGSGGGGSAGPRGRPRASLAVVARRGRRPRGRARSRRRRW